MRRWLALALVAAGVGLVLRFMDTRLDSPGPVAAPASVELPRYSVTGAEWVRLDASGQPELRARAGEIDYYADESVLMRDLTLDSLGGRSSPWTMSAPKGRVPPRERQVLLEGEVVAMGEYADEPVRFTTGELWVDLLRREMRTEAPVVLESEFRRASARGLRADFEGENVQLLNDVQVEYVPGS